MNRFNILADNKYWTLLKESNDLHVTARMKHVTLLKELEADGIRFKNIENFLMEQARKSGLLRKNKSSADGVREPNKKELKNVAWYRELRNFMRWLSKNYKDYNVSADRKAHSNPKRATVVTRKKYVSKYGKGKFIVPEEERTEIIGATSEEIKNSKPSIPATPPKSAEEIIKEKEEAEKRVNANVSTPNPAKVKPIGKQPSEPASNDIVPPEAITDPVTKDLTVLQKQQLILANLDVLGAICVEQGASEEFNHLMIALQQEHLMIPEEESAVG